MKKHTNFTDEIYHEEMPESLLVHLLWLTPGFLLIGYILYTLFTTT